MISNARAFEARPTPARVSAQAAAKFPRWLLWGIAFVYLVAGLFGRAPWPQDDAAGFGVMRHMAQAIGSADAAGWWLPTVAGQQVVDEGPLAFWVGAGFVHGFGPLFGEVAAARLACGLWFLIALVCVWHATYRLAKRDEAQPIAFVFGGEAQPHEYGRMLADNAVLLLIGTLGIALRVHETSAEPAALAWLALGLYGLTLTLKRPYVGGAVAGSALGLWALTQGAAHAPFLATAMVATLFFTRDTRVPTWVWLKAASLLLASATAVFALWPLLAHLYAPEAATRYFDAWRTFWAAGYDWPNWRNIGWISRNWLWYVWPLWPLAAWVLYTWRHSWQAPHVCLPIIWVVGGVAALLFSKTPADAGLILLVPSLTILAAFGTVTLRRGADNGIDWMAIMLFSFMAFIVWAYYVAMQTGVPVKMAASIARLTPDFMAPFQPWVLLAACVVTIGWILLIIWRVWHRPAVLWRGPLLAAGGTVMLWTILSCLFMPAVDYNRSYAPLARRIAAQATAQAGVNACFMPHRLTAAHLALFSYFGDLRFAQIDKGEVCPLALHRDARTTMLDDDPPPGDWQLVWEDSWPARPDERLRIYRRLAR